MTNVITIRSARHVLATCDRTCYDSNAPQCTCCCQAINHGIGLDDAIRNNLNDNPQIPRAYLGPGSRFRYFITRHRHPQRLILLF